MQICIYENNLLWSVRIKRQAEALGHTAVVFKSGESVPAEADIAIVNLSSDSFDMTQLIPALKAAKCYVIGHAGHKETEKIQQGKALGCDQVVSNSTMTHKLDQVLSELLDKNAI